MFGIARFRFAFGLGARATLFVGAMVLTGVGFMMAASLWITSERQAERARHDAAVNLNGLAVLLRQSMPDMKVTIEGGFIRSITALTMPDFPEHTLADASALAGSGVATIFVTDAQGQFIRRSTNVRLQNGNRALGTALAADHPAQVPLKASQPYYGPATLFGRQFYTAYHPVVGPTGSVIGVLFVGIPLEFYTASRHELMTTLGAAAVVIAILMGIVGLLAIRSVIRPLDAIAASMKRVADGDLVSPLPVIVRGDEIGQIAEALAHLHGSALTARDVAAERATADSEKIAHAERLAAAMSRFEAEIGEGISTARSALTAIEAGGERLGQTSAIMTSTAGVATTALTEAEQHVRAAASSSEALAGSIGEISRRLAESSAATSKAVGEAKAASGRVDHLVEATGRIEAVVGLINAVAAQTNLLALNATIEAARAGEAGRGFAVVASEVKQLAGQTAKATEEIVSQVAAMQAATAETATAIRTIAGTIGTIDGIANAITGSVEEQEGATRTIDRSVAEALRRADAALAAMTKVADACEAAEAARAGVLRSGADVRASADNIVRSFDDFVSGMRAA